MQAEAGAASGVAARRTRAAPGPPALEISALAFGPEQTGLMPARHSLLGAVSFPYGAGRRGMSGTRDSTDAVVLVPGCRTVRRWVRIGSVWAHGAGPARDGSRRAHDGHPPRPQHAGGTPGAEPRPALRGIESSTTAQEPREYSLIGSGVLLETGRVGPDGKFVRPRLLIGRQSPELNAWMQSIGVTPERCMLPMFRGRLTRVLGDRKDRCSGASVRTLHVLLRYPSPSRHCIGVGEDWPTSG